PTRRPTSWRPRGEEPVITVALDLPSLASSPPDCGPMRYAARRPFASRVTRAPAAISSPGPNSRGESALHAAIAPAISEANPAWPAAGSAALWLRMSYLSSALLSSSVASLREPRAASVWRASSASSWEMTDRVSARLSMVGFLRYFVVADAVKAHSRIHRRGPHLPSVALCRARADGAPVPPPIHRQVQVRQGARIASRELCEELQARDRPVPLPAPWNRSRRR